MTDSELKLLIETEIARYCTRVGRHGETYPLEKGLRDGLVEKLVFEIQKSLAQ
jgi:hypothetical protein